MQVLPALSCGSGRRPMIDWGTVAAVVVLVIISAFL